jgi:hypothetical protein
MAIRMKAPLRNGQIGLIAIFAVVGDFSEGEMALDPVLMMLMLDALWPCNPAMARILMMRLLATAPRPA